MLDLFANDVVVVVGNVAVNHVPMMTAVAQRQTFSPLLRRANVLG